MPDFAYLWQATVAYYLLLDNQRKEDPLDFLDNEFEELVSIFTFVICVAYSEHFIVPIWNESLNILDWRYSIVKHMWGHALCILASITNPPESRFLITSMNADHSQVASSHSQAVTVEYLWTQSLLPSTKIQMKRCVPNGIILRLSRIPEN